MAVGLGGSSSVLGQLGADEGIDADDIAGSVSERLRGKTLMGSGAENPIDKVAGALGIPVPTPAFVPRAPSENILLGPGTDENVEGLYRPRDPGFDVLYHSANKKALVLGKWLIEPALKERLMDGSILGALGPESRKQGAAGKKEEANSGKKQGASKSGAHSGSVPGRRTGNAATDPSDDAAFEWKHQEGSDALQLAKREAAMDPRELARRRRQ